MDSTFDYIIVGGGTAGVVIASRLKEFVPSSRIALLEAGPNAVDHPKVNDTSETVAWIGLLQEGLVHDYSTTPQEHLGGRVLPNPAGRMLSGSSGVNVATWMRPSAADLDLIAERAGSERFKFKNMVKYFNKVETHYDASADKELYGLNGPVHTVGGRKYPLRKILQESAERLGHHFSTNDYKGDPTGLTDFVQCFKATSESTSTRQHSAKVYNLTGVDVFCDTPVARILIDNTKRATGVQLLDGRTLPAAKEVIVSCGTQRTPQLLMLSGIGPASQLSKHNIPQVLDNPAIGANLFDHASFFMYYKLKPPYTRGYTVPFTGQSQPSYTQGFPIDFSLFAPIASSQLLPSLKADGVVGSAAGDALLRLNRNHTLSLTIYEPMIRNAVVWPTATLHSPHVTLAAFNMLPLARGSVTLASSNPEDNPVCNPNLLGSATDRYILRHAVRSNLALISTPPFSNTIEAEVPPLQFPPLGPESSDEQIDERIKAMTGTINHPMGTCALGTVLDAEFRVKGVQGLRVCDASVFPEVVGCMPSCLVYAMGEMCADVLSERA